MTWATSTDWEVITDDDGKYLFSRYESWGGREGENGPPPPGNYAPEDGEWTGHAIVCMKITQNFQSTCHISKKLEEGHKFQHPLQIFSGEDFFRSTHLEEDVFDSDFSDNFFHSDFISLPARYDRFRDIVFENAQVTSSTSLLEGDTIDSCDAGHRTVVDSQREIVMCLKRDAIQCASFMGDFEYNVYSTVYEQQTNMITDCSNHRIYTTCAGLVRGYNRIQQLFRA